MNYREAVERVLQSNQVDLLYAVLGLAGESGEVADLYKKSAFRDSGEILEDKLLEELGDVRFYLEVACIVLGIETSEIEQNNIKKILKGKHAKHNTNDLN